MDQLNLLANDPVLIRAVGFFGPALALLALATIHRPARPGPRRATAAAIVATAWSGATLYPLNLAAVHLGWWSFHATGALWDGIPVDLWLGWALLWGAIPALLVPRVPVTLVVAALALVDLVLMPLAEPVVVLGPEWLVGEAVGLALCLTPAVLLAAWTRQRRRLAARSWGQVVLAGVLMFALPLYLLGAAPAGPPAVTGIGVQVLLLVLLPGLAATRAFAAVGGGTPLPYDPPTRLVTSGPYSYVRNPMQLSVALGFLVCAALTADPLLLLGTATALCFGSGVAAWHEDAELRRRFGEGWTTYRDQVRPWLPRLRPWPGRPPADLYVAATCDLCRGVAGWLTARHPVALRLVPAESHPEGIRRMTYHGADGVHASGVAALARALEHLNLGWALVGWALAVPGVAPAVGLCADALGAGQRTRVPRGDSGSRTSSKTTADTDSAGEVPEPAPLTPRNIRGSCTSPSPPPRTRP